jgi:hypothetical protein
MNCAMSKITISRECANRHEMMAASLPDRLQCPDLGIPGLSVARGLSEDGERFQLGSLGLSFIHEGGMEDLIPIPSHKFLD